MSVFLLCQHILSCTTSRRVFHQYHSGPEGDIKRCRRFTWEFSLVQSLCKSSLLLVAYWTSFTMYNITTKTLSHMQQALDKFHGHFCQS